MVLLGSADIDVELKQLVSLGVRDRLLLHNLSIFDHSFLVQGVVWEALVVFGGNQLKDVLDTGQTAEAELLHLSWPDYSQIKVFASEGDNGTR